MYKGVDKDPQAQLLKEMLLIHHRKNTHSQKPREEKETGLQVYSYCTACGACLACTLATYSNNSLQHIVHGGYILFIYKLCITKFPRITCFNSYVTDWREVIRNYGPSSQVSD